ncbi:MAG: sugar phosphate isomerase/epimerase family protein [Oscillospiraceae bacterium]|jgi:2-keto-myo-inositol isomerase
MKLCFNEATTIGNSTLEQDLILCERLGYDLIEIRLDKLREYLQTHSIADLKAFFASSKLKPYAFNALEGINFRTPEEWEELLSGLDLFCQVGKEIGCNKVVIVPTNDVGHKTKDEIKASSLEAIRAIDERARKNGWPMNLAFEFVGYPNLCVNTFGQAYDIVEAANMENVGVVLDCFHFHAMNSRWEDLERLDIGKLFIFHIDDSEDLPVGALRDEHRLWPGDGAIDLDRIFALLKKKGYSEMASVELFRPEYYDLPAEDTIRIAKEKSVAALSGHWNIE